MLWDLIKELFTLSLTTEVGFGVTNLSAEHPFLSMVVASLFAFLFGAIMALVYYFTHKHDGVSLNFTFVIAMLPAAIGVLILLVGDRIARGFSLAGIFALMRFRSVQTDPKDLGVIAYVMAVGLAAGLKLLSYALAFTIFFAVFMIVACLIKKAQGNKRLHCQLRITVPEDMNWDQRFDEVLERYTRRKNLVRMKTIEFGSFFELTYDITLRPGVNEKEMIDALRERNGNLTIILNKRNDNFYMAKSAN